MPITNIYPKIYDFDNLYHAYLEARKGKRYRGDVLDFSAHLEEELIELQNELIWQTYRVGPYHQFYIHEPKKRLIMALQFRDRVVQWAIYRQLNPLLDRQFIYASYGCRVGKGMHRAVGKLQYWMRAVSRKPGRWYYLKLDISKFFYRIDHETLLNILRRKIHDDRLIWLLGTIINSEDTHFGLPIGETIESCPPNKMLSNCGVPIGNLTSQMFANLYLNELDQYAKHTLKLHYYIRYMDDIIILYPNKQALHQIKDLIEQFLKKNLLLDLNKKTAIRPVSVGVEFVGFKVYVTHRKLKRRSLKKMKSRLQYLKKAFARGSVSLDDIRATLCSYCGMMKHFNSYGLRRKISSALILERRDRNGTKKYRWKWGRRIVNTDTIVAIIGCVGTISTVLFAYLGFKRGVQQQREADDDRRKREEEQKKDEGEDTGALKSDMSYIRRRVDDILLEQRDTNKAVNALAERVTRVEESTKQAHHRIDENSSDIRNLQNYAKSQHEEESN